MNIMAAIAVVHAVALDWSVACICVMYGHQ